MGVCAVVGDDPDAVAEVAADPGGLEDGESEVDELEACGTVAQPAAITTTAARAQNFSRLNRCILSSSEIVFPLPHQRESFDAVNRPVAGMCSELVLNFRRTHTQERVDMQFPLQRAGQGRSVCSPLLQTPLGVVLHGCVAGLHVPREL